MEYKELEPFGLELVPRDLSEVLSLKDKLESLVWENGFILIRRLPTEWQTIYAISSVLGNVADASPVELNSCQFVGQITGQCYEDGTPKGRMGKTSAVDWHSDNCATKSLRPFILFQGIENVEGGYQQYLSNEMVYNSLDESLKRELESAEGLFYFNHDVFQNDLEDLIAPHENWKPLIVEKPTGRKSFFYPWLFCKEIRGTSSNKEVFEELRNVFEEWESIYSHLWGTGDLFITESIGTQHRRPPTANASERLLFRVNCGREFNF